MIHHLRSPLWQRSLPMGCFCAIPGLLAGVYIALSAWGNGWELFAVAAPLGAFLSGLGMWRLIVAVRPSKGRGLLAGFLAGLVAHWVCWYLLMLLHWLGFIFFGTGTSSLGEPPVNPLQALWGAAAFSFFSLLLCGWITGPVGAGIGYVLGRRQS